ncbi:MAG: NAD+ synthase [Saprospiraceae bacterium]|nr:NAD+ synthase [Saprospiraceae bacterium]MBK8485439.1 NAD+ synthase [Saprospiraceae bacterium]MBK9222667.1 NAD+ synthase [Saprospiraceae bacterium]MBK9727283.1 NAD+ synthase [Saprospiraceae bacterium]
MKIALAQLNYHIGNFDNNFSIMKDAVISAKAQNADLICFSELATCGYPPRDFLEFKDFIKQSIQVVNQLCELSDGIGIVVGAPTVNPNLEGKDLYNSAFFLFNKKVQSITHKALLPNYDIFDEYRYFEPNRNFETIIFKEKRIAITICEDIWNLGNKNPMYTICPLDEIIEEKPDFILNLSASPFDFEHTKFRLDVIRANVLKYKIPMFYINCVGSQTDILFDGGSAVLSADGLCFDELPFFEPCIQYYNLEEVQKGGVSNEQRKVEIELIYKGLVLGIKDYFAKMGFSKAILGLSGGIDSALTAVLAVDALGKENVKVLLLPSQYSSTGSVTDAEALAKNLGISYDIIPIQEVFDQYEMTLLPYFKDVPENVTEENIQARIRGMLLMAFSNKFSYILLNTTNKSEMAVGYGTLYGDLCGGLAVLADVYKSQVYLLAHYVNRNSEIIPINTIQKPPSAELRPGQKDSDSLPDYSILDKILYQYIEKRQGPNEIIALGFDEATVLRSLKMVNRAEFKRYQSPPVIRVSSKSFGLGRRLPIEGKYLC